MRRASMSLGLMAVLAVAVAAAVAAPREPAPRVGRGSDAERVAALFGLAYERVEALGDIREAPGTLLHVRTDRAENVALHRRLHEAVAVRIGR